MPKSQLLLLSLLASSLHAQDMIARRTDTGQGTVLPGGRLLSPYGEQFQAGPGTFGLALSPTGQQTAAANGGPERFSLTLVQQGAVREFIAPKDKDDKADEDDWRGVFLGLAFAGEDRLYVAEGENGRVRVLDPASGKKRAAFKLDGSHSYSGDLAFDPVRGLLYVLDQAHFRMVVLDAAHGRVLGSVPVGRLPFAIALSPDRQRVYVTHVGLFRYQLVPGLDEKNVLATGLPFPPFGFPSRAAKNGTKIDGRVIPGLGDPHVREANSVAVIDVADPAKPRVETYVQTGVPLGKQSVGGSSPSGVVATAEFLYVSNAHQDSVTVIDARTLRVKSEIGLRVPGAEKLRGVMPIGLAYVPARQWLLVAEAGINAVAIVDTKTRQVLGHVPSGWFPARVAVHEETVWVANAKGHGTGPNASLTGPLPRTGPLRHGTLSKWQLPAAAELPALTAQVWANNHLPPAPPSSLPSLQHVVIIVKENRTFDEVFGDVSGAPALARFGKAVTPNHHALVQQWSMSDNFYADSEVSVDGHHWLVGSTPDAWTETTLMAGYGGQKQYRADNETPGRLLFPGSDASVHPEEMPQAGTLWHHLERHRISFRNFGEGFELAGVKEQEGMKPTGARLLTNIPMPDPLFRNTARDYPGYNTNIPDQYRATQLIADLSKRSTLPRLLFIHLPNDHTAGPRPRDGYPNAAAYVADNDYALGRIVEYLSHTKAWPQMAIFVTEDDAQGGVDHIDSHRTLMMIASPWAKRGYVSHRNASFPSLLKTVFGLLGMPPLNLNDASAADLSDCFQRQPDLTPFTLQKLDPAIFNPAKAREPKDPIPVPRMDGPGQ